MNKKGVKRKKIFVFNLYIDYHLNMSEKLKFDKMVCNLKLLVKIDQKPVTVHDQACKISIADARDV